MMVAFYHHSSIAPHAHSGKSASLFKEFLVKPFFVGNSNSSTFGLSDCAARKRAAPVEFVMTTDWDPSQLQGAFGAVRPLAFALAVCLIGITACTELPQYQKPPIMLPLETRLVGGQIEKSLRVVENANFQMNECSARHCYTDITDGRLNPGVYRLAIHS